MTHTSIYTLTNICQSYNTKIALDIPHLSIAPGSITGLMGPNGSGKSTLLKLLAFVAPAMQGKILFLGKPEVPFSPGVRFNVSLLTQTPYLLKRSVYDNIIHGLKIRKKAHGLKDPKVQKQVRAVMAEVGLSYDAFAHRMDYELSGGEAQRVAMAARLILKPRVLLLDEPTASVDINSATLIRRAALYARQNWGTTIVIASHDRDWLQGSCDTLFQLYQGKIFQAGSKNIIPGPFVQDDQGFFHTLPATQDHQPIRVSPPPHETASALLDAHNININEIDEVNAHADDAAIKGELLRLLRDKNNGQIIATIRMNDLDFTILLTRETVIRKKLLPGAQVLLTYDPDNIEWI